MALESVTIKDASDLTETIATDEVGGLNYQVLKLAFGADGTATLVDGSNGLPVLVMASLPAGSAVIGKVDINNSIPAGANTIGAVTIATLPAGTNNIGDVDLASAIPAGSNLIGQVDLNSVPAAAATTDKTTAVLASDAIGIGTNPITQLTPKFAKANVTAATTDSNIVTAVTAKKIRVLSFRIHTAGTATNVTFNSKPAGAGAAISELFACGANGGRSEGFNPVGHFETVAGEGLAVTTGAGSTTGVGVSYIEV